MPGPPRSPPLFPSPFHSTASRLMGLRAPLSASTSAPAHKVPNREACFVTQVRVCRKRSQNKFGLLQMRPPIPEACQKYPEKKGVAYMGCKSRCVVATGYTCWPCMMQRPAATGLEFGSSSHGANLSPGQLWHMPVPALSRVPNPLLLRFAQSSCRIFKTYI